MNNHQRAIKRDSNKGRSLFRFICIFIVMASFLGSLTNPMSTSRAIAVNAPILISPNNGVITTAVAESGSSLVLPPLGIPQFSWEPVEGATSYILRLTQLAGQCQSSPAVYYDYGTSLTTFIPPNVALLADGQWFWCVRVNAVQSPFSEVRSFTKDWSSSGNTANLISPADNAILNFYDHPTFSWQPVVGASFYRLEIATASDFVNKAYVVTTVATTHQPVSKLSNGSYYWRVIPLDPSSHEGTISQARQFSLGYQHKPVQVEPLNGSSPTFTPTFRWSAVRGAQYYILQYSPDSNFASGLIAINTTNTKFTPAIPLNNDTTYYWRVRAVSGLSTSDWSDVWTFFKQWYIRPVLLTPTNNALNVRIPYFTWTPVPGAQYYYLEISLDNSFANIVLAMSGLANNFYSPLAFDGGGKRYYWRVIPYDSAGRIGRPSQSFSFDSKSDFLVPDLIYPFYYYRPNTFPAPDQGVAMNPYADRTAVYPVFYWHRMTNPAPIGGTAAYAYRIQVSTTPNFNSIVWTEDTQNTHAAPTNANPFVPTPNTDYFWRVRGLDQSNTPIGFWSQVWLAHFNLPGSGGLASAVPVLYRPTDASEIVETTPIFEWERVANATAYEVQLSAESSFSTPVITATVRFPVFSPVESIAQHFLGKIKFGTYYWRVRALTGVTPMGAWSEIRRFQIAAQSERTTAARTAHIAANKILIATDPGGDVPGDFDLTTLYATQDSDYWYFGFNTATITDTNFVLYMDVDSKSNSGASSDPLGGGISTISSHRPEFALHINQTDGVFDAGQVDLYAWNGASWDIPRPLDSIGGKVYTSTGYVELGVPITAIGMSEDTGSYSLSLFSLNSNGQPQDSAPSDPQIPGNGSISYFASVSERLNPVLPPNTSPGEKLVSPFVTPFYWDYPTGSNGTTPWIGARVRVYLDVGATNQVNEFVFASTPTYYAATSHHWATDFIQGDKPYYWRVQPLYFGSVYGAWSQIQRMERQGWIPQNLTESVSFATPTFSWDRVEGALSYELSVDNDPGFSSPDVLVITTENNYIPTFTLPAGHYYWRVRVYRFGNVVNEWSPVKEFDLTYPSPSGLAPNDPNPLHAVGSTPTFCWDTMLISDNQNVPILAAYMYRVQVSTSNLFGVIYDNIDTEQNCWTPTRAYADGTYYWRVAMIDGNGRLGPFSAAAMFVKESPAAKPQYPVFGDPVVSTPVFRWTAYDGVTPYVQGADRYLLRIYTDPIFSQLYDEVITNNTSFTPIKKYDAPKKYYWRVAIIDPQGNQGPFSDAILLIDPFPYRLYMPFTSR